ncbi:tRNA (uridine(34)/cytosine(34)/5-carboxymethylaminomethyluridine(34)-2'-O)-methyltransferase TrmL [Betaproteobacteria bacterium GR16-43]|nr:tRNA (uridine(34)/cytosine(34)/5-carboxymethylaminomethyluridine(34)-2'-O)-methyltransferase TrmL [Betaproteobacteria bacterium GR16-43]
MFHIVLFQPEIPPNTGNVIRLCANVGARLHLVEPLGFSLEDKLLRRAGLDYHEMASVTVHRDWAACRAQLGAARLFATSTRAQTLYTDARYQAGDAFVFGAEAAGLPESFLEAFQPGMRIRLPMRPGNRSLNLSNAVAVVAFEAWRQAHFSGAA